MNFQAIFMLSGYLFVIGFFVIVFLIVRSICRGFKNFIFELVDHIKGTAPKTSTSKKDYTAEAQKAYEDVTPKRKQNITPPWEE